LNANATPDIIFIILALLLLARLTYIQLKKKKHQAISAKYQSSAYRGEIYSKIYSPQFLGVWALFTLSLIFKLAFDLYKNTALRLSPYLIVAGLIVFIIISGSTLYLWSSLFKKDK